MSESADRSESSAPLRNSRKGSEPIRYSTLVWEGDAARCRNLFGLALASGTEQGGVGEDLATAVDHAEPGELALVELDQDPLGVLRVEAVARLDGGRQQTPLLRHRALLGIQQVAFIGVEKQTRRRPAGRREEC